MTISTYPYQTKDGKKYVCKVAQLGIVTYGDTRSEATLKALVEIDLIALEDK